MLVLEGPGTAAISTWAGDAAPMHACYALTGRGKKPGAGVEWQQPVLHAQHAGTPLCATCAMSATNFQH